MMQTKPKNNEHGVAFSEAAKIWLRVALLSFGGPAGQIAVMHKIVVEEKNWISEARFLHALNYCMLLPGPEAQQLATYIGWLMHKTAGGLLAGGLFVAPGALVMMGLSYLYAVFGGVGFVAALFFGLKAAVLAVVAQAVLRIARRALRNNATRMLAVAAFAAIFFFNVPFPLIVIAAAIVGFCGAWMQSPVFDGLAHSDAAEKRNSLLGETVPAHAQPSWRAALKTACLWLTLWLAPPALLIFWLGPNAVFSEIAFFFSKMAAVTFGGAYAVLAYVAQQAVERYHWLGPREMLDGLGMAETTPGPLVLVLQFVGFMAAYRSPSALPALIAAPLGGLLATWATFAPSFLWIFVGAPYIEALRGNKILTGALTAITAAIVGVMLNLALWFAIHGLFHKTTAVRAFGLWFDAPVWSSLDPWAFALTIASFVLVFIFSRGLTQTFGLCALAGLILYGLGFLPAAP